MNHWIFQGNPDIFDVNSYLTENSDIVWSVRQKHFANEMKPGDEAFIWRASGTEGLIAGIIARGTLTGYLREMENDLASEELWEEAKEAQVELRVPIKLKEKCLGAKEIVRRDWLKDDPIVSGMRILKFFSETNYLIGSNEAERLAALVRNTGRDWNRAESIAGLWAYTQTMDKPISRLRGSPVSEVALSIGRAVTGIYNKVMNFRALDPTDLRKGLSARSHIDEEVWNEFFDFENGEVRIDALNAAYYRLWGKGPVRRESIVSYLEFGDAPNDDREELQMFAARVRKGQPAFRKNLLAAYGKKCAISGWGPAEVLEAIHIMQHAKTGINELDNGLLIRGDLHSLFDANLLRINPVSLTIVIDDSLAGTPYWDLNGKTLRPRVDGTQIGTKYLKERWNAQID